MKINELKQLSAKLYNELDDVSLQKFKQLEEILSDEDSRKVFAKNPRQALIKLGFAESEIKLSDNAKVTFVALDEELPQSTPEHLYLPDVNKANAHVLSERSLENVAGGIDPITLAVGGGIFLGAFAIASVAGIALAHLGINGVTAWKIIDKK